MYSDIKKCSGCIFFYPASKEYFHIDSKKNDGFQSRCKYCINKKNKGKYVERQPYFKQRYEDKKDDILGKQHKFKQENRDTVLGWKRHYYLSERGRKAAVAKENRRRTRIKKAGGKFTANDIDVMLVNQNYSCYYCHCKLEEKKRRSYHVDHVIPVSKGGTSDSSNLVIACPSCNLQKGAKLNWKPKFYTNESE